MSGVLKVAVVGQTPPPYGGQAVMIRHLLDGSYDGVEMHHVRLAFSRTMSDVGRPSIKKVGHLLSAMFRLSWTRFRWGATVLYYPPAGPDRVPMYRDLVLLLSTRWMFQTTIFHFHAGGVSQLYPELPPWLKWAFRRAYFGADVGVRTSALAPDDPKQLHSRRDVVAAYGVPDVAARRRQPVPSSAALPDVEPGVPRRILSVGVLRESKGVLVLLEACEELHRRGHCFRADLVGEFSGEGFEQRARELVEAAGLDGVVNFPGPLAADAKYQAFANADIFCFPSFFESETFGVVLIEAMQFGLPIVASNWRGIPTVVTDGVNGYLVPVRDAAALAERLDILLNQPNLAAAMGARGREIYESEYTLGAYQHRIQSLFDSLRVPQPS